MTDYVGKLVKVEWEDAFSLDTWLTMAELEEEMVPLECVTYGIVAGVTDHCMAISATLNAAADIASTMVLPKTMIKTITLIEQKEIQCPTLNLDGLSE